MIGQMQGMSYSAPSIGGYKSAATEGRPGKYQLQVFPDAGHFIHEDQPAKTAQVLADFYTRNNRILTLPPKVGDMLKAGRKNIA